MNPPRKELILPLEKYIDIGHMVQIAHIVQLGHMPYGYDIRLVNVKLLIYKLWLLDHIDY